MKRNISETPEKWVVLKLPNNHYKIFSTWGSGYIGRDIWKLNSGIDRVEQDDNNYYFIGFSRSCYKCDKTRYGTASSYGEGVLSKIIKQSNGQIVLMDNINDWSKLNELKI